MARKKKEEVIVETPIVNDEIVEAAKAEYENEKVNLKIEIGFNDKYTNVEYKVEKVIAFEEKRANELLADPRKLVSKA